MHLAVYATLGADALAVLVALAAARLLHPRTATRLLTAASMVVAASWSVAAAVLATGAFGGLVVAADLQRAPRSITLPSPAPGAVEALALAAVAFGAVGVAVELRRRWGLGRTFRALRRTAGGDGLVIVDEPAPIAFALPGRSARIVASPAMLRALDAEGRRVLLAHEHAHARFHHHLYIGVVDLAAVCCPLLRPLRDRVRYATERWADESTADELGARRPVAVAVARAGLASARWAPAPAFGGADVVGRVSALLRPAPRRRAWLLLGPAVSSLAAAVLAGEAVHDLERLLEAAVRLAH